MGCINVAISFIYDSYSLAGDSHFFLSLKIVCGSGNFLERNWHRLHQKRSQKKHQSFIPLCQLQGGLRNLTLWDLEMHSQQRSRVVGCFMAFPLKRAFWIASETKVLYSSKPQPCTLQRKRLLQQCIDETVVTETITCTCKTCSLIKLLQFNSEIYIHTGSISILGLK